MAGEIYAAGGGQRGGIDSWGGEIWMVVVVVLGCPSVLGLSRAMAQSQ